MKLLIRQHVVILVFALAFLFSNGSESVFAKNSKNTLGVEDLSSMKYLRIKQGLSPWETISLEFSHLESNDSGKTWEDRGRYRIILDKRKGWFVSEFYPVPKLEKGKYEEEVHKIFYKDNIVIDVAMFRVRKPSKKEEVRHVARIGKFDSWKRKLPSAIRVLLQYNMDSWHSLWTGNKIVYPNPLIFDTQIRGKNGIQICSPFLKSKSFFQEQFTFDKNSGLLFEKNTLVCKRVGDKIVETILSKLEIEDYAFHNGFPFPTVVTVTYPLGGGEQDKFVVNKNTVKVNEKRKEEDFVPVFLNGTKVEDEIKEISYTAPFVGSPGSVKNIVEKLDELFEKTQK